MKKTLSNVTVKDADQGLVEAVFSTFNVIDKDGDVTLPGAIKDGTEVVISAYGHGSWDGRLPVGKGVIRATDTEAVIEGQFFMDTTHGSDTFKTVKGLGPMGEWSYSLQNVKSHRGEMDGKAVNFLEYIEVKETSPVLVGAGVNTRTLSTKGAETLKDQITEAVDAVNSVIDGVERVVALRTEKGKSLSVTNTESLVGLSEATDRLKALLEQEPSSETADEIPEDIKAIADDLFWSDLSRHLQGAQS